jgi:threonine aldolase
VRKSVFTVPSRASRSVSTLSVEKGTVEASSSRKVRGGSSSRRSRRRRGPSTPTLAAAEGRLTALAQGLLEKGQVHRTTVASAVVIDLRSDTVTKPTPGMLAAMAAAEVGDEQEREDPTTNELQRRMAELLGHEAALFFPTATMANQAALRVLSRPGCKVVAEERTHVLIYEWGGPAIHSGLVMQGLVAEAGRPTPEQVEELDEFGPGSVLVLENTHRSSGGRIWPWTSSARSSTSHRARGAAVHLDGARLFNAAVGAGVEPVGVGSICRHRHHLLLEGARLPLRRDPRRPAETIERAWEGKFLFGGALRQSGIASAAMLYALDHHVERLAEDHAHAKRLAQGIGLDPATVETNFVPIPNEPGLPSGCSSVEWASAASGRGGCAP